MASAPLSEVYTLMIKVLSFFQFLKTNIKDTHYLIHIILTTVTGHAERCITYLQDVHRWQCVVIFLVPFFHHRYVSKIESLGLCYQNLEFCDR